MIKSELIQRLAYEHPNLFHKDVERIVNVVFDEIIAAMARGDRVELRGFGAFSVKHRAPRTARNPRTGKPVTVKEKFVPFFKTGKDLRERLNRPQPAPGAQPQQAPAPKRTGGRRRAAEAATAQRSR